MRKKNRRVLVIALGVALVAVVVVLSQPPLLESLLKFAHAPIKKVSRPDELLKQYFTYISSDQYEDMYEMLAAQSQASISNEDFVAKNKGIYNGIDAKNITITIGQITENKKSECKIVEYSIHMDTAPGEISYTNNAIFNLNEEKEYKMLWSTHTIFPNLNPSDKVRVKTLTARRGCIYDRNREMLAGPGTASVVGFVPGKMSKDGEVTPPSTPAPNYNEDDIAKIAELLEMSPEGIVKKLKASYVKDDTFVVLRSISKDATELTEELLTVKGILISDTPVRYYPLGEKASHLVGYIQGINAEELEVLREQGYHANSILGKAGLEKIYEEQLRAKDGCEIIIVDSNGELKETLAKKNAIDGKDIVLTIDSWVQSQLYDLFAEDKSSSVAMNPKTGEVLALVSTPTYDANDFVLGMPMSKWTTLSEDENKPMLNRFKSALCPGSTMKALTAAIGINTGIISPDDDFGHSGLRWRKDGSWGGYYVTTTKEYDGSANIENALVYSDNIYFAKAAMKIGADTFAEQLINIGFEERIPFEYGLYSSTISSTETFTSEIQLADSGFGQGQILINPIHLASIYAAFVNEGNILQPRLIYEHDSVPIIWKENAFSPETAKSVLDGLIQVIERGTGKDAKIPRVTLAGKTGTAEIKQSKDDKTGTELGWFAILTADENVKKPVLVITMVEDVKNRGGSHYVVSRIKKLFGQEVWK